MKYVSYSDMATTIRANLWKIPHDVDLVVGVPRSGMIAALMIAEVMNKRVADIDTFLDDRVMGMGGRGGLIRETPIRKVLVVDDTVFTGTNMQKVRERLEPLAAHFEFIFACIYTDGFGAKQKVDIVLEDIAGQDGPLVLYEWNIFHHYEEVSSQMMWDVDGLMCQEPPWDSDTEAYERYLPEAVPMVIPSTKVGAIVTYRLEKYRDVTEEWLERMGVRYGRLIMFPADTADERNKLCPSWRFKAMIYKENEWAHLFVESSDFQAELIRHYAGKPAYAYETGRVYT